MTGTGPQSWYGEIVSYGSGTETRYGIGVPVQSAADSVSPPERRGEVGRRDLAAVERAPGPSSRRRRRCVAGSSCDEPRYTWLRVSSNTSYGAPTCRVAIAYERAATACAFSASGDQVGRHLRRDDAVEVLLEPDDVHRAQLPVDDVDLIWPRYGSLSDSGPPRPARKVSGAGSGCGVACPSTGEHERRRRT